MVHSTYNGFLYWGYAIPVSAEPTVPLKQLFQISSPRSKLRPHILPRVNMSTPTMFPCDKKTPGQKKVVFKTVLIPF